MLKKQIIAEFCIILAGLSSALAQEKKFFPGADEKTPSRSQYFSWINNTNEGASDKQTLINLDFYQWLKEDYGMVLDIYAFDAGTIDGKNFYGSMMSDRFKKQFPNGFGPLAKKAASSGIRFGIWGGPVGFGNTPEEEKARIETIVSLCRDFNWELFKMDAVCGQLRPEKYDAFNLAASKGLVRVKYPSLIDIDILFSTYQRFTNLLGCLLPKAKKRLIRFSIPLFVLSV